MFVLLWDFPMLFAPPLIIHQNNYFLLASKGVNGLIMQNEIWNRIYGRKSLPSFFFYLKSIWILCMEMGLNQWIHKKKILFLHQKVILITWFLMYLLNSNMAFHVKALKIHDFKYAFLTSLFRIQKSVQLCDVYWNSDLRKRSSLRGFKTPPNTT